MSDDVLSDPDLLAALRHLGARERSRPQPLCPRCARRPQSSPDGMCTECSHERHEAEKARKRRWWTEHGREWRAARAAAVTDQPPPPKSTARAARARQTQAAT